jgi:hypothetical protein
MFATLDDTAKPNPGNSTCYKDIYGVGIGALTGKYEMNCIDGVSADWYPNGQDDTGIDSSSVTYYYPATANQPSFGPQPFGTPGKFGDGTYDQTSATWEACVWGC